MICRADSPIARDMLSVALRDQNMRRRLHRLGIAMHTYADTFAHQGFIGALSKGNRAENVTSGNAIVDKGIRAISKKKLLTRIWVKIKAIWQLVMTSFQMAIREHKSLLKFWRDFFRGDPLGHAATDTFPDQPYLVWQYTDYTGNLVTRNNPTTYMQAFNMMVKVMQAWWAEDKSMDLDKYPGMSAEDAAVMEKLIRQVTDPDGEVRHEEWCKAVAQGVFSFGPSTLSYQAKGVGSWKEAALYTTKKKDTGFEIYQYSPEFLDSHWKHFHDALQAHRADVVHGILLKYGICAA